MDADNCELACGLVSKSYIAQGQAALGKRVKSVKALLSSRRLPQEGWDDATIEMFVKDCALMDSNNFLGNVGVGEREGRVACGLVARRHYGLSHGIGRSGDVAAEQPKAAGSSLLAKLTNILAADAMKLAGLSGLGPVTVLPTATGMALTLTLLAVRASRPAGAPGAAPPDTVLWSRIDQKTCLKAISAAGLVPVVVELRREGDELVTDIEALQAAMQRLGPGRLAAVVTTTSCFAPRAPDDVVTVAKMCAAADVPHVINNAYGIQCAALCKAVSSAWNKGRVDAIVQSTDKNFMVPVGGAIVAAPANRPGVVEAVNSNYPGRAAVAAHLDLLMTLLHWGADGWKKMLSERESNFPYLREQLQALAGEVGERLLATPSNPVSLAFSLDTLSMEQQAAGQAQQQQAQQQQQEGAPEATARGEQSGPEQGGGGPSGSGMHAGGDGGGGQPVSTAKAGPDATFLGSMLWQRNVSGTRVVPRGKTQKVAGLSFSGYGSHCDDYGTVYLTAACALGTVRRDVDEFVARLRKCLAEFKGKQCKAAQAKGAKEGKAAGQGQ